MTTDPPRDAVPPDSPAEETKGSRQWELTLILVAAVLAALGSCASAVIGIWRVSLRSRADVDEQVRQERRDSYASLVQSADRTADAFGAYDACSDASSGTTSAGEIRDAVEAFEAAESDTTLTATLPVITASNDVLSVVVKSYRVVVDSVTAGEDCQKYSPRVRNSASEIESSVDDLRIAMRKDLQYLY